MRASRQVVDYSLRKRALLREVQAGRVSTYEVCDASPYLKSAARFHGEPTEQRCPVCRADNLTYVHYIYGEELKNAAGQAHKQAELAALAVTLGEFQVFVVEVCPSCAWNHLVEQYLLGDEPQPNLDNVDQSPTDTGDVRHGRSFLASDRPAAATQPRPSVRDDQPPAARWAAAAFATTTGRCDR